MIPAAGEPCLVVRKNLERARRESALKKVVPFEGSARLAELAQELIPAGCKLGLELDVLPANLYIRYRKLFAAHEVVDVSPLIRRLRAEIALRDRPAEGSRTLRPCLPRQRDYHPA